MMGKYDTMFGLNKFIINFTGKLLSISRILYSYNIRNHLKRNTELLSRRKTDRCFICGLGPSLQEIDLTKITEDIIVVNRFRLFDSKRLINPTYFCMVDEEFFKGHSTDYLKSTVAEDVDSAFVLNAKFFKQTKDILKKTENCYFVSMWSGILKAEKVIDFTKNLPALGNVMVVAIVLALYVGYREIILLGADFNSFASTSRKHCYSEDDNMSILSLSSELFTYSFVADNHYELRKYAEKHGVRIINATKGSLLDAYEKDLSISDRLAKSG